MHAACCGHEAEAVERLTRRPVTLTPTIGWVANAHDDGRVQSELGLKRVALANQQTTGAPDYRGSGHRLEQEHALAHHVRGLAANVLKDRQRIRADSNGGIDDAYPRVAEGIGTIKSRAQQVVDQLHLRLHHRPWRGVDAVLADSRGFRQPQEFVVQRGQIGRGRRVASQHFGKRLPLRVGRPNRHGA